MCICVLVLSHPCMHACTHMTHDVHVEVRGQVAEMDFLIPIPLVLGIELTSSSLASSAFTHRALSLTLGLSFESKIPVSYVLSERIKRINFVQSGKTS